MTYKQSFDLSRLQANYLFIVLIVCAILTDTLSKGFILKSIVPLGKTASIIWGILRVLGSLIISSVVAYIAFKKIKYYDSKGLTWRRIFIISIAVSLLLMFAVFSYRAIRATNESEQQDKIARADMNDRILNLINQKLPIDKKQSNQIDISKLTFLYAQDTYRYEGRIIEYRTPGDKSILFTPTREDQKAREVILFMQIYNFTSKLILIIFCLLPALAITSALLKGLLFKDVNGSQRS